MLKSVDTNIEGHTGIGIKLSSRDAYAMLLERRFKNIEQCAFLLSFLEISPESPEWRIVSDILNEIKYPQDLVSDFFLDRRLKLTAIQNTVTLSETYVGEDLHCEAADIHFEKRDISFEDMILQQNLRVYAYITGQDGKPVGQIKLYGIITLMPLQPIISINDNVLLPGCLYTLKLTSEMAQQSHRYAMRKFIFDHKQDMIDTIKREVQEVLGKQKENPELINALAKIIDKYIWGSKLGLALASLGRELLALDNTVNTEDIEKKIEMILSDIVVKIETYPEPKDELDFSTLLVKPGRMVGSKSRKTHELLVN